MLLFSVVSTRVKWRFWSRGSVVPCAGGSIQVSFTNREVWVCQRFSQVLHIIKCPVTALKLHFTLFCISVVQLILWYEMWNGENWTLWDVHDWTWYSKLIKRDLAEHDMFLDQHPCWIWNYFPTTNKYTGNKPYLAKSCCALKANFF